MKFPVTGFNSGPYSAAAFGVCPLPTTPAPPNTLPATIFVKSQEERVKDRILLSTPKDKTQQKRANEIVSTIKNIAAADATVNDYINAVLHYLPDFKIRVVSKIPHIQS